MSAADRAAILKEYPDKAWMLDDPELAALLKRSTDEAWSADTLKANLIQTNWYRVHGTALTLNQLQDERNKWLVPMTDAAMTDWAMKLATGQAQPGEFQRYMQQQAASLYGPQVAAAINQGIDVKTFIDPYVSHAANLLGINPSAIDLSDSKWLRSIQNVDPKTGNKSVMSLSDWDQTVRSDPVYGWQNSENGKNAAYQVVQTIRSAMGKAS